MPACLCQSDIWKRLVDPPRFLGPSPAHIVPPASFKVISSLAQEHPRAHQPQALHHPMKTQSKWRQNNNKKKPKHKKPASGSPWMLALLPSGLSPTSALTTQLSTLSPSIMPVPLAVPVPAGSSRQPEAQHDLERKLFSLWKLHGAPLPRPCRPPPPNAILLLFPCGASGQNKQLAGQCSSEQLQHRVGRLFQEAATSPASSPREPSWKTPESGLNLLIRPHLQPDLMLCRIGHPRTPPLQAPSAILIHLLCVGCLNPGIQSVL